MASTLTDRLLGPNGGAAFKAPVACATTENINLSGEQMIDGVLTSSTSVLVKDQDDLSENGVYTSSTGMWLRRADFDGVRDIVSGTQIYVTNGTANIGNVWVVSTSNPIVVGTTNISFSIGASSKRPVYPISRAIGSSSIDYSSYNWFGNTNSGSFTYTLPPGVQGAMLRIVNTGTSNNNLNITPDGIEKLIGLNSSFALADGEVLIIAYDTTDGWY